jgi:hypothetical protein
MSENEKANGRDPSFARISEAFLNMDLRKSMALYLDFIENLTKQVLDFQETSMNWAKETPFEPFVEFKTSIARKLVETSFNAVRNLYQIETPSS